ncbi:hypothetical protein DFH11DRAFT_1550212 [Phellopilus nigrolimitatus]|nr:hypothetical protein DFH11DRAFT_1550212 [Phellopilus nigrolimitatus]
MVNRAQLDDYARQKRLQAADETLRNAAEAYLKAQEQGVFRNGIPSLERVATAFNVSRTTLTRLIHGGRTAFEYAASQLKLSSAQEEKLILYLLECADRGFPQNVKSSFRATGLHPFDPSVITPAQMKTSEATSIEGTFPIPQPSPVKAVINAFRSNPPTSFDLSPSTHQRAPEENGARASSVGTHTLAHPVSPSKGTRLMTTALAQTSAAFLLSKEKLSASQPLPVYAFQSTRNLPAPDWSVLKPMENQFPHSVAKDGIAARDAQIEGDRAQMIIQNLYLTKQQEALHAKEKKKAKTNESIKLFPEGKGRHLTSKAFLRLKHEQELRKREEKVSSKRRKKARLAGKAKKALESAAWEAECEKHAKEMERWQQETDELKARNTPKSDLRPRPKRRLKRDVIAEALACKDTTADDTEEDEDSSEGEVIEWDPELDQDDSDAEEDE